MQLVSLFRLRFCLVCVVVCVCESARQSSGGSGLFVCVFHFVAYLVFGDISDFVFVLVEHLFGWRTRIFFVRRCKRSVAFCDVLFGCLSFHFFAIKN